MLEHIVSRALEIKYGTLAEMGHVQALLQNKLPEARLLEECQKGQDTPHCRIAADYLEHVDIKTGFTPLLAAVFWHRAQAARLVGAEYQANMLMCQTCRKLWYIIPEAGASAIVFPKIVI